MMDYVADVASVMHRRCEMFKMRGAEWGLGEIMRSKPILSALAVMTAVYVAYPYFAIYRLGEALRSGDPFSGEYRLREGDGDRYRWFLVNALPSRSAGGGIARWIGTCTDIEAAKWVEEREAFLANASEQLAAAAFANAPYVRRERFRTQRHMALPMEPRGLLAEWDAARGRLTVFGAAKVLFFNRRVIAKALGLDEKWAYNAIKAVGNYGESFERNVGQGSSLKIARGLNALWTKGGLQYGLPIR